MNTEADSIATMVNGQAAGTVPVFDRGLQFGDGVFETIRIHRGKPVWWEQHVERLLYGCRQLCFSRVPNVSLLFREASELTAKVDTGVLKIIITRGNSNSGYAPPQDTRENRILIVSSGQRHAVQADKGIRLGLCEQRISSAPGALSGIKHLNRLDQVLGRLECVNHGWDEGVMLDQEDHPIEGTMSNLFILKENSLLTPSLEKSGIRGICREFILGHAHKSGFDTEECELGVDDLLESDGLFICNSLVGIWPVRYFIDRSYENNERSMQLRRTVEEAMCS
jgi:4-amino-4-deoxychorismate lyase